MKARRRLTTLAVLTAIALSTGIGLISLFNGRSSEYQSLDNKLSRVIDDIAASRRQPLSAGVYSIQDHNFDFALILTPEGATPIEILGTSEGYDPDTTYRTKSITVNQGDVITVAGSTREIEENFQKNLRRLGIIIPTLTALLIALGFFYMRSLTRRQEQLALAQMQNFLGDASHELRTPLTIIKGYSEMLSGGQLTDDAMRERAFSRVNSEIQRMENIISDLLLLSELGEVGEPVFDEVDLKDVLESHIRDFTLLHPERKVEIHISEKVIQGDREHLHRLLHNALGNISRHTPDNAPVRITLDDHGKLVIEDGGPGLPDNAYGENFAHFQRFDRSRSRDKGGSGLGMSIMQAIAAEHGARIAFRRSELGGLAVEILLP